MTVTFEAPGPGPWMQDSAHNPHGNSPLVVEVYPDGAMKGFAETLTRWGTLLDGLMFVSVNGFTYVQPQPFDRPGPDGPPPPEQLGAEIGRRTAVAAAAFENKIWRDVIERWNSELKPAAVARHRELGDVELGDLDDDELRDQIEQRIEHVRAMAYQHHRFNGSAMIPVADFALHAAAWIGVPPTHLLGVFDGYSPSSAVVSPEIRPAVEALRGDAEARELLRSPGDPAAALAQLRERVPEVDEYVRSVGFRLLEGFDITAVTAIERPETILGRLDVAIDTDADAARRRADETAAAFRQQVPAEHRDEFDELLTEARLAYPLRDERGLYSDISAFGLLRLAMLEAGRRLHARGALHEVDHIFETVSDELLALVSGRPAPSADELAERAAARRSLIDHGAPRLLGPPPPPPPVDELPPPLARVMSALGFAIDGILGEMEAPGGDDMTIAGITGNEGTYEGTVHLVHAIDDLFSMEPGAVLVTAATGEAFNAMLHLVGAIVTDHGSYASHASIVAREAGFPAVVGCVDATQRLQQGQRVLVDGTAGEVRVLS